MSGIFMKIYKDMAITPLRNFHEKTYSILTFVT